MDDKQQEDQPVEGSTTHVTHSDLRADYLEESQQSRVRDFKRVGIIAGLFLVGILGLVLGLFLAGDSQVTKNESLSTETVEPEQGLETLTIEDIEAAVKTNPKLWDDSTESILAAYDKSNKNVLLKYGANTITITGNGLPNHDTGDFPNEENPNSISEQDAAYEISRSPKYIGTITDVRIFAVSLGGVPMEPGTAETDPQTGWNIEAFNSGIFGAGTDFNNAHVQPNGTYHYHGLPTSLIINDESEHSNLIGFAADGFPVYGNHGYRDPANPDGPVDHMTSSWRLKEGERGAGEPEGVYNGDYTQDFAYRENTGDLDECNGRFTVTPEFPNGTYAYFITEQFPYIGRCIKGEVLTSFDNNNPGTPPRR